MSTTQATLEKVSTDRNTTANTDRQPTRSEITQAVPLPSIDVIDDWDEWKELAGLVTGGVLCAIENTHTGTQTMADDTDSEETDDHLAIEDVQTDRYGVPTAAHDALARAHGNWIAICDHSDRLFDSILVTRTLGYPEELPEDPLGVYRDVQTRRLIEVGRNETRGWFVSRDYETGETNVFEPGEVVPAIESRRLVPVSKDDDGQLHDLRPKACKAVLGV